MKYIHVFLKALGFCPLSFINFFKGLPFYIRDYRRLKKQLKDVEDFKFGPLYPVLDERNSSSGVMKGHYFHQDLLIARKVFENNPAKHVDIGSRVDGLVAHIAVFRKIEIFDIRKQESTIKNIIFKQADLMRQKGDLLEYCDSISSLHVIEHLGLGRYGDPIDINGHIKAINNIHGILKAHGKFYFSVPIGKQRIEFNAHRVFSLEYLLKILKPIFIIDNFNYVDDSGNLFENVKLVSDKVADNFDCKYGCGIFELTKI